MVPTGRRRKAEAMLFRTSRLIRALRRRDRPPRLVDCEHCGRDFVVPVAWIDLDAERWWIRIRCGECGTAREVVLDDEQARRFEADVDAGARELAWSLARAGRVRCDPERSDL
jgi:hypothetical protein